MNSFLRRTVQILNPVRRQAISRVLFSSDAPAKPTVSPKITLISDNDQIQIVTLDTAKKLSKRRDLKLVKIVDLDTKTQRAVYKLMSGAEYHSEELKRREEKKISKKNPQIKGEKLLSLTSRIAEHDLNSKLSTIEKWVKKYYEVRIVINMNENELQKAEEIVKSIEEKTAELGKVVQKRNTDNSIRFQIIPLLKKHEADSSEATDQKPTNPSQMQTRSYHTI